MFEFPLSLFHSIMEPFFTKFIIVICIVIIVLLIKMFKTNQNRTPYGWLIFHFVVIFIAGQFFYHAINPAPNYNLPQSVLYDQIKFLLWMSIISWIFSLFILLVAMSQFKEQQ